jgi:pSer/pThr/pTyr-binding forkhead associated (FHA) protein
MPKFTISRGSQELQTLTLEGEKIELGSARTCPLFLDDLLISLRQAAFVKTTGGYRLEPLARTPSLRLNGRVVDQASPVTPGDVVEIEGYQIRVDFEGPAVAAAEQPPPPIDLITDPAKTVFIVPIKPLGQLVVIAGPLKGTVRPLMPGEIKIGRDKDQNDIVIRNDSKGEIDKSISRRHASLHVEGTSVFVEDQKSVAGTFVNGRQAPPKQRIMLKSGDQIEIRSAKESTIFRLELEAPGSAPPASPPLSDLPPVPPLSEVPLPLSDAPLPPPLPVTPLPVKPRPLTPPPRRDPSPSWGPPPEPIQEPADEPVVRPSRVRPRATFDDNLFLPSEEAGLLKSLPQWVWLAGGAALIILIVSLLLICR